MAFRNLSAHGYDAIHHEFELAHGRGLEVRELVVRREKEAGSLLPEIGLDYPHIDLDRFDVEGRSSGINERLTLMLS